MPASIIHTGDKLLFVMKPGALITTPTGPARITIPTKPSKELQNKLCQPEVLAATSLTFDLLRPTEVQWLAFVRRKCYPFVTTVTINCDDLAG